LKSPFFFSIVAVGIVTLQAGVSYWSYRFFMAGDLILGSLYFLLVPVLALFLAFFYVWFRRGKND
jgi:hypothetical protein